MSTQSITWISTKEKLPELNTPVLIIYIDRYGSKEIGIATLHKSDIRPHICEETHGFRPYGCNFEFRNYTCCCDDHRDEVYFWAEITNIPNIIKETI